MKRLFCGLVAIAAFGCSKAAPPAGKVVAAEQVCNEADGSRVRVSGYLRYRRGLMSFCSSYGGKKTCDLALYATAAAPPDFDLLRPAKGPEPVNVRLSVPVGTEPGEMDELPKKFAAGDVRLHLPNDGVATESSRVTIDGKLSVIPADGSQPNAPKSCFVTVEWAAP